MKISDIDKNLEVKSKAPFDDIKWLDVKDAPFRIHGLKVCEKGKRFLRMPDADAKRVSDGVRALNTHTSGGRIRFRTNSKYIAIKVDMPDSGAMPHMTPLAQNGFDLYTSDNGRHKWAAVFLPGERNHGYEAWCTTDGVTHTYTMYMPIFSSVNELYIGLESGAEVEVAEDYTVAKPVLFYGSSITHGACASRSGNIYEAMISRMYDCDYYNLGFSGRAKGEQAMAEYCGSVDCDVFVFDYDHNAYSAEELRATHYDFYRTFRRLNPNAEIIFVTRPDYNEKIRADIDRREVVIETYEKAIAEGDCRVRFVDGARLFDGFMRDSCTVDGCHPNDLGFARMAEHIGAAVGDALRNVEKGKK